MSHNKNLILIVAYFPYYHLMTISRIFFRNVAVSTTLLTASAFCVGPSFENYWKSAFRKYEKNRPSPHVTTSTYLSRDSYQPSALKLHVERFRVGDYYIWMYFDTEKGTHTSFEKYTVTNVTENGLIEIEMSTRFPKENEYKIHHRLTVDLPFHINAAKKNKEDWNIKFEYKDEEGRWTKFGSGDNVQAFEEKFDCFSMLSQFNDEQCQDEVLESKLVQINSTPTNLTRSTRHLYTDAWYAPKSHDLLSGVAVLKHFKEHSFALIETGRSLVGPVSIGVEY